MSKNNCFEGLGMIKYSKFTPSTNPTGKDGKPWNNARLHFVLICNRTNSKKLAQEGRQSADFISCSAQGVMAESISQYFPDGSMIFVYGHLESYTKEEENGGKSYGMVMKIDDYHASYNLLSRTQIEMLHQKNLERDAQKAQNNPNSYGNAAYTNQNPVNAGGYVAPNVNQQNNVAQHMQNNVNTMHVQNVPQYSNQTSGNGMTYNPGYNAPMAGNPGYVQPAPGNGTGNGTGAIPGYSAPAAPANPSGMGMPSPNNSGAPAGAPNNMQFGELNGNLVISDDDLPF